MLCRNPKFRKKAGGITKCGQCLHCRINRRREKSGRAALEAAMHEGDALFVTLTYKNDYLPVIIFDEKTGEAKYEHPTGCLDKRAVQLFFKRLLKKYPPKSIRYFYCGEYGDDNERPHYHMVIWGVPWSKRSDIIDCWTDTATGELQCDPDRLQIEIPKSQHDVANYCTGYIMKARTNVNNSAVVNWLDGRPPEFCHSSKGIGRGAIAGIAAALQKGNSNLPRDFVLNGRSYPLDRYTKQKLMEILTHGETLQEKQWAEYQEEMRSLLLRAKNSPTFITPENQFVSEKAVEMDQVEKRLNFFERKK